MVLAAAAPLLGLLGTVTGMVETFRVIGLYGMGNAQAMASGIKAALITTQAGLLVAIPGLLIGQALSKKVKGIHREILIFHRAVTQWLEKESRSMHRIGGTLGPDSREIDDVEINMMPLIDMIFHSAHLFSGDRQLRSGVRGGGQPARSGIGRGQRGHRTGGGRDLRWRYIYR